VKPTNRDAAEAPPLACPRARADRVRRQGKHPDRRRSAPCAGARPARDVRFRKRDRRPSDPTPPWRVESAPWRRLRRAEITLTVHLTDSAINLVHCHRNFNLVHCHRNSECLHEVKLIVDLIHEGGIANGAPGNCCAIRPALAECRLAVELIDPPLYSRRHLATGRRFCEPLKRSVLPPWTNGQRR
jgi:hypothetical protein